MALRPESLVADRTGRCPDGAGAALDARRQSLLVEVEGLGQVGARNAGVEPLAPGDAVRLRLEPDSVGQIDGGAGAAEAEQRATD